MMISIIIIPLIIGMFLAVNMGGSGTAAAFSAAHGSGIIRKDLIPGLFGTALFFGAIFCGKKVTLMIGEGIMPGEFMGLTIVSIILLSVAFSLLIANILKIPQSTSQATIAALVGPAWYLGVLKSERLFYEIIPTWFILPIVAFFITLIIGKFIYPPIKKIEGIKLDQLSSHFSLKIIVIITALYVAFAIGSNNVANAAGPICLMVANNLGISPESSQFTLIMLLATLIMAPCFAIGSSIFGNRLLQTTGKGIVEFGPMGAILVSLVTASLLLLASAIKGIPTSLVQMNTAAIIGLGISKVGYKEILKLASIKQILTVWIISPVIALVISVLFTMLADHLGWL